MGKTRVFIINEKDEVESMVMERQEYRKVKSSVYRTRKEAENALALLKGLRENFDKTLKKHKKKLKEDEKNEWQYSTDSESESESEFEDKPEAKVKTASEILKKGGWLAGGRKYRRNFNY